MDWNDIESPSLDDVETLARAAFDGLPAEFRALTGQILFRIEDFPDAEVIEDMELETEFDIHFALELALVENLPRSSRRIIRLFS